MMPSPLASSLANIAVRPAANSSLDTKPSPFLSKRSNMPWPRSASAAPPRTVRPRPAEMTNAKALRIRVPFWLRIESDPLPSLTNLSGKPCEEAKLLSRLHFVGGQSAVAVHIQLIEDLLA